MSKQETEETIDIENAGATAAVHLLGATIVSAHIRGDATAEYQWDVKTRDGDWIENVNTDHTGSADYDAVYETGMDQVRIRCSTGTSSAGDQATVTLSAGGG